MSGTTVFLVELQLVPHSVNSIVPRFCARSEWQQCGLRPQNSDGTAKGRFGPTTLLCLQPSLSHHGFPVTDRGCTTYRVFVPFNVEGLHIVCSEMAEVLACFAPRHD